MQITFSQISFSKIILWYMLSGQGNLTRATGIYSKLKSTNLTTQQTK